MQTRQEKNLDEFHAQPVAQISAFELESKQKNSRYRYMPYINLVYLMFLFFPLVFDSDTNRTSIILTLVSAVLFLPLHFLSYKSNGRYVIYTAPATLALCYLLLPHNFGANTYLIYAVISVAYVLKVRQAVGFLLLSILIFAGLVVWLEMHLLFLFATTIMAGMLVFYTLYERSIARSNQSLQLTQREIQRLAQSAERERIGRDLHDVLGHTLSLIVMKTDLANRLMKNDPSAAAIQIQEVEKVARDALGQVRVAVAGIRLLGLEAELASARLTLMSADIHLHYQLAPLVLSSEIETVLALAVREAVTNIIRHSNASQVEIELTQVGSELSLQISDNGKNTLLVPGHGLGGMRERFELLGGKLEIDTGPHGGVRLNLSCPLVLGEAHSSDSTSLSMSQREC